MPFLFLLPALLGLFAAPAAAASPPALAARAWLLVDHASGQELAAHNADQKVEPASLTKMMTAYLAFAALREDRLRRDQEVPVSAQAWRTPGARMFIAPDRPVTVAELLHGMIVQSGNDASIALAETIAGSEETFVAAMNREAQRLGMSDTHYANVTGLPAPAHLTTARDLARLASALIRDFPDDYRLFALKDYRYNGIRQANRNRLLWLDPAIDGIKTGRTESAGHCLVASRQDGARRLTAVVLGTASEQARVAETLTLLHHGFTAYEAARLYEKGQALAQIRVFKGADATAAAGFAAPFVLSLPRGVAGTGERLTAEIASRQPLIAPVRQGDRIATLRLTLDGKPFGEYPLVALDDVPVAGPLGRTWDTLKLWFE